jgi:hypothetical protein
LITVKAGVPVPRFPLAPEAINALIGLLLSWLLAGRPNIVITGWGPEEGIGRVANSRHNVFAAFDLRRTTEAFQVAGQWRRLGGESIDEGDHVHLE